MNEKTLIANLYFLFCVAFLPQHIFLPSIVTTAKYFETNYSTMQFAISAFMAGGATLQIILGPLSDRFGRRPILLISLLGFILVTVGCIFSSDAYSFLFFRTLQALSIGGLVIGRAIVADTQNPNEIFKIMANLAIIMAFITITGPVLGEFIDTRYGWKFSFYFLLLLGLVLLVINFIALPETNTKKIDSFWDQIAQYRLLFRIRLFWVYVLTGNFATASFFSLLVAIPYCVQKIFFLEASWIGFIIGIIVSGFIMGNIISSKFSKRVTEFAWLATGYFFLIFSITLSLLLYKTMQTFPLVLFFPFFFIGIGNGFIWPISIAGAVTINQHLRGSASGLHGASMYMIGAIFSSILAIWISQSNGIWPIYFVLTVSTVLGILVISRFNLEKKRYQAI